jgi:hypothetical protein
MAARASRREEVQEPRSLGLGETQHHVRLAASGGEGGRGLAGVVRQRRIGAGPELQLDEVEIAVLGRL